MSRSNFQRPLMVPISAASLLTVAYYARGITDGPSVSVKTFPTTVLLYLLTALLALSPYGMLWIILGYGFRTPAAPLTAFIPVTAPAPILFLFVWRGGLEGWQYFLVPGIQLIIAIVLLCAASVLKD